MTEASVPTDGDTGATGATTPLRTARSATPLWLAVTIAVLFGVLYAYDVWEAVRDLVGMSLLVGDLGVSFAGSGSALLIAALVAAVASCSHSRSGSAGTATRSCRSVLFLTGYAVVQAITLDLAAFFELGGIDFS